MGALAIWQPAPTMSTGAVAGERGRSSRTCLYRWHGALQDSCLSGAVFFLCPPPWLVESAPKEDQWWTRHSRGGALGDQLWALHPSRLHWLPPSLHSMRVAHWWSSHSRRDPLVDPPFHGRPSGGPSTPWHWWALHSRGSLLSEPQPQVRSTGGPAIPEEVHWWTSHSRGSPPPPPQPPPPSP